PGGLAGRVPVVGEVVGDAVCCGVPDGGELAYLVGAVLVFVGEANGHRFISSTIRLARSSPLMSPDQYWCSTASTFSSGRVGSVRAVITACARTSVAIGSSGYRARIASATR